MPDAQSTPHHHVSFDAMAADLDRSADLDEEWNQAAADWLAGLLGQVGRASAFHICDVGCGAGGMAVALAQAFPAAHVVALDEQPLLLERAAARARLRGVGARVTTREADLDHGLDEHDGFDLVWSSAAIHHVGHQSSALHGLARALRPGGLIALAEGGLPPRHLPSDLGWGRPGLEARLDAAQEAWFARMREELDGFVREPDDWPALLSAAGTAHVATRSFLIDMPAPLGAAARAHVRASLERRAHHAGDALDAADQDVLKTLLADDDPAGIMRRPDIFLLGARTVYVATRHAEVIR